VCLFLNTTTPSFSSCLNTVEKMPQHAIETSEAICHPVKILREKCAFKT